ncbi:hypothetical protein SeMB42_g02261 [Synchytrium endobioticum]|uniref:Uncharacterized protein n=1 Tax=Synchytrium endobioticum TaxID=286115 RepID=A0A507DFS0_9FUNG|nr:hypothetical protein SeLEV6574_g06832 [Synchytrium endobioticum]TPX50385.1 hypothetical protein SeMB42_g02260 [Synchytrium endobioticum]TPX50386.1 hypothetical protein SeMB42_g02261 [Synchytrium endobioticum]
MTYREAVNHWDAVFDHDPTSAKSQTSMKRHRQRGKVVDELDKTVNDDVMTGLAAALEVKFKVEKASGEADI